MSIQVEPWLSEIFLITTGSGFPEADEDQLRKLAQVWYTAGTDLTSLITDVQSATAGAVTAVQGLGAQDFVNTIESLTQGTVADGCTQLGQIIDATALDVEYTKWTLIGQLVLLALQILWLIASSYFDFGLSLAAIPGLVALGRTLAGRLIMQLISHIITGIVMQEVIDAAVQAAQFAAGTRHQWDWEKTKMSVVSGALGGIGGFALHGLAHPIEHFLEGFLEHANLFVRKFASLGGEAIKSGAEEYLHAFLTNGIYPYIDGHPEQSRWGASYGDFTAGAFSHLMMRGGHRIAYAVTPFAKFNPFSVLANLPAISREALAAILPLPTGPLPRSVLAGLNQVGFASVRPAALAALPEISAGRKVPAGAIAGRGPGSTGAGGSLGPDHRAATGAGPGRLRPAQPGRTARCRAGTVGRPGLGRPARVGRHRPRSHAAGRPPADARHGLDRRGAGRAVHGRCHEPGRDQHAHAGRAAAGRVRSRPADYGCRGIERLNRAGYRVEWFGQPDHFSLQRGAQQLGRTSLQPAGAGLASHR